MWRINAEQKEYYKKQFAYNRGDIIGNIRGSEAKSFFEKSGLPVSELSRIWKLSDIDRDGALILPEFCIAMHLTVLRRNNVELPKAVPDSLMEIFNDLVAEEANQMSSPYCLSTSSSSALIKDLDGLAEKVKSHSLDSKDDSIISEACVGYINLPSMNNTKNWTQFNNSPIPSSVESTSRASPEQLPVNFDYNVELITSNPAIKHPVALRYSPSSTSPSTIVCYENIGQITKSAAENDNTDESSGNNYSLTLPSSEDWHLSLESISGELNNRTNQPITPTTATFWSNGEYTLSDCNIAK